jgi:hypothetical protein
MAIKKIDRPPSAHNWVRYIHPDELKTAKAIVAFVTGSPQITYSAGLPIIRDRITFKLDRETANKAANSRGHKKSRRYVADFVNAFIDYDEVRNYSGLPSYDQDVAAYQIGRDIRVPVKPLVVISENGVLKPIFTVGWATMPLILHQRRLLMTVLEDAVFSLTDFQGSPGEFISFPRGDNSKVRSPEVWRRGDYELLSKAEMKVQIATYLKALEIAKDIIAGKMPPASDEKTEDKTAVMDRAQTEMEV